MAFFLDSNVIIGYYFACGDSKGKSATKVIENTDVKYTSTNVWSECWGTGNNGRCHTISFEISDEFSNSVFLLTTGEYSTSDLIIAAIDEELRITEIIEYLYERYSKDLKSFIDRLRKAQRKYENECNARKNALDSGSLVTIHHRTATYPQVEQHFNLNVPDPSDIKILLDAHDLGLTIQDLTFVSADGTHILSNKHEILKMSSFNRIISLNSF